uniref:Uncharacterized protein n=2 Tax=Helianthus annuus TaxID=4232 RepID=A0A251TGK3_HELAN
MIDPTLKEETDKKSCIPNRGANKDSLHKFLKVANQCVSETQDQRPTIKAVLNELEKALVFQEEQVQQLGKDQVVDKLEKARHEIPEEQVKQLGTDQVVDKLEKARHEIPVRH